MSLPIFPVLRYYGWAVSQKMTWNSAQQVSPAGAKYTLSFMPSNPIWKWEWNYEVLKNKKGTTDLPYYPTNSLYTDLQAIMGFYAYNRGPGLEFVYQPPDSAVVNVLIATPDANNYSELRAPLGAVFNPNGSLFATQYEAVQELNGGGVTLTANGASFTNFGLVGANTISPYEGIVIHFNTTPTPPVLATFTKYYRCTFDEDDQDYEQFAYNLYELKSLKYTQSRVVP